MKQEISRKALKILGLRHFVDNVETVNLRTYKQGGGSHIIVKIKGKQACLQTGRKIKISTSLKRLKNVDIVDN